MRVVIKGGWYDCDSSVTVTLSRSERGLDWDWRLQGCWTWGLGWDWGPDWSRGLGCDWRLQGFWKRGLGWDWGPDWNRGLSWDWRSGSDRGLGWDWGPGWGWEPDWDWEPGKILKTRPILMTGLDDTQNTEVQEKVGSAETLWIYNTDSFVQHTRQFCTRRDRNCRQSRSYEMHDARRHEYWRHKRQCNVEVRSYLHPSMQFAEVFALPVFILECYTLPAEWV